MSLIENVICIEALKLNEHEFIMKMYLKSDYLPDLSHLYKIIPK